MVRDIESNHSRFGNPSRVWINGSWYQFDDRRRALLATQSPGRKFAFDFLKETDASLRRRVIHVVTSQIVTARARRAIEPHRAFEKSARRVAHQEGRPTRAAIGANGAEPFDVV
jgi:hypothetical protein